MDCLLLGNIIQLTRVTNLINTDNGFAFTFIKHQFKQRDVLDIACLVEKVIMQGIRFKVCVCYIFSGLFFMSKREHL